MTAPTSTASTSTASTSTGTAPARRLPAGYGYEWARFRDWCAATDHPALPAHPVTVAGFLYDHPAPAGTQRRRLAAVTAAHTAAGHPSPASASAIRALLHSTAVLSADEELAAAARNRVLTDVIRHLPTTGWPHGLFGRRDALLLVLTAAGLGPTAAVGLHRGDVTPSPDRQLGVTLGPFDRVLLPPTDDPRTCPGCVHRRWAEVLASTDDDPTGRTLRTALHTATAPGPDRPHPCARPAPPWPVAAAGYPLLTSVDGWGWLPWEGTGLTPAHAAHLVTAHLTGAPAAHRTLKVPATPGEDPAVSAAPPPPAVRVTTPAERATQAAAAVRRRRDDQAAMAAASDALTGIDAHVAQLLQRTLDLLEGSPPPPGGPTAAGGRNRGVAGGV